MKVKWFDEPGEPPKSNWFKDHPMATMGILTLAIVAIVVVTV